MGTIRKRGKRWQAMVRLVGHSPESRSFPTRALAAGWVDEREEALRSGRPGGHGRTVGDAMRHYAEHVSPLHRGERWERVRLARMGRDDLAGLSIDAVTAADIARWRDRRLADVSAGSVLREWSLLRSVFEVAAVDLGWRRDNPMRGARKPSAPAHRDRRISDDEIERLRLALGWPSDDVPVRTLSQQVAVMLLLAIETAMRAGEMHGLDWSRVDLRARYARLLATKNGTARDVPLSTRAVQLLAGLGPQSSGPVFMVAPGSRDALFRKARSAARIEGLTFHDTRHEAITRLARRLDVLDLARMVGHRDLGSLRVYYNATATEIAARLD